MRDESGRFESDLESGLFPTFFFSGFECSTFVWKDGERKDYVALTRHDCHLQADYGRVLELGIGTVREAIRWPLVDRAEGSYDWSSVEPVVDVVHRCHITPLWDLCHYGFPDGTHPLQPDCVSRFTAYCRAVAGYLKERMRPPHFFTPVNEITFLSGASTDMEWIYPFAKGRRDEMRIALCRMAIEGAQAIRSVLPDARMVHVDPVIHEVPPPGRPDLAEKAWLDAYAEGYRAWDILAGRHHAE